MQLPKFKAKKKKWVVFALKELFKTFKIFSSPFLMDYEPSSVKFLMMGNNYKLKAGIKNSGACSCVDRLQSDW